MGDRSRGCRGVGFTGQQLESQTFGAKVDDDTTSSVRDALRLHMGTHTTVPAHGCGSFDLVQTAENKQGATQEFKHIW